MNAIVSIITGSIVRIIAPKNPFIIPHEELQTSISVSADEVIVPIPDTIITIDAVKVVPTGNIETPFTIVNDEEKLTILRQQNMDYIRQTRNQLLSACDWCVMPDSPFSEDKLAEWKAYRQALRDFPNTCEPIRPVWPDKPT